MPNPFTGEPYFYEKTNLPLTSNDTAQEYVKPAPTIPVANSLPQGSLQGTMTQPKQGSLTDFARVMRAISEDAYDYRQKKEGKITSKQFDPSKVSGSIFKQIMGTVEAKRGGDISKIYEGAIDAAKFDLQQKEEQRQFDIEQENKKFDIIKQKTELGIDSIYIPTSSRIASVHNNPGNLMFANQNGATQGEPKYNQAGQITGYWAKFNTPEDGFQALMNQIRLDASRGDTIATFIRDYAPKADNNRTDEYISIIANELGTIPDAPLSSLDFELLASAVAKHESGTQLVKASSDKEMTAGQVTAFNGIVSKFNASPLIAAADRTIILKNTIEEVKKDPSNAAQQLNLAYSYIQALDTYQSAVREGELSLVNSIGSKIQQFESSIQKIQKGQIVNPDVALQIADAAQTIVDTISKGAEQKAKSFSSQAETVGLGNQWKKYISGFQTGYSQSVKFRDPKTGEVKEFTNLTEEDIQEALNQGFIKI